MTDTTSLSERLLALLRDADVLRAKNEPVIPSAVLIRTLREAATVLAEREAMTAEAEAWRRWAGGRKPNDPLLLDYNEMIVEVRSASARVSTLESALAEREALTANTDWYRVCDEAWTALDESAIAEPDASLPRAIRKFRERAEARVSALQRGLEEARGEEEKWRTVSRVLCAAHLGVPQQTCPVCESASLREQLAAVQALPDKWRDLDTDGYAHDPCLACLLQCAEELDTALQSAGRDAGTRLAP